MSNLISLIERVALTLALLASATSLAQAQVHPYPEMAEESVVTVFNDAVTDSVIDSLRRGARDDEQGAIAYIVVLEKLGRMDDAEQGLARVSRRHSTDWLKALEGAFLVRRGQHEEAIEILANIAESEQGDVSRFARYWRARSYAALGRHSRSDLELRDLIEIARHESASPMDLLLGAIAARETDRFQIANELFRRALELRPRSVQIRIAWAELFEEKYRADEAAALLQEALEVSQHDPSTQAELSWLLLEHANDATQAGQLAGQALDTTPSQPVAIMTQARIAMDAKQFDRAADALRGVILTYPTERGLVHLFAAAIYLSGDDDEFRAIERQALRYNPRDAEFYHVVAEAAARVFRYPEALRFSETAIMRNPDYAPAYLSAAFGYSRVGEDEKTLSYLRRAFARDPYNVMAFNMVNLWEQTFEHYSLLQDPEIPMLRYRMASRELSVLSLLVPPVIRKAWREYSERYQYEPEPPVSFEIFSDSESFGIRSVGLPNIGLHGICFGHVVTARSPSEGNFNYRVVYEHELSHVFTLQYSNYRVPRWLSEGMAEYDTWATNHGWGRTEDIALLTRLQTGQLTSIDGLDLAFLRSKSSADMIAAYFQSFMATRFIVDTYTHDGLIKLLQAYRDGDQTAAAVERGLGVTVEHFDTEFEVWLREQYAPMLDNYEPAVAVWKHQDSSPDAYVQARALTARKVIEDAPDEARAAIEVLEASAPERPQDAAFLRGILAMRIGRSALAYNELKSSYDSAGAPSYTLGLALGEMALEREEAEAAIGFLRAAADAYPMGPEPHLMLARTYEQRGDEALAWQSWEAVFERDSNSFEAAMKTAARARSGGNLELALRASERANNIQPFNRDAVQQRIELLRLAGDASEADRLTTVLRTIETAASVSQ